MAKNISSVFNTILELLEDVRRWALWLIGIGLTLILGAAVIELYGFNIPLIPNMGFQAFAWAAGGYWLIRKAG